MKFIKTRKGVVNPQRANNNDSGIDFFLPGDALTDDIITILPGENIIIPMGIKIKLDEGYDMTFVNRSSIASGKGLILGACLVDNGYRGELKVNLINISKYEARLVPGDKVVQGVVRKVSYIEPEEINEDEFNKEETERGEGGFGSSNLFGKLKK